ncbi:MAG: hypothetical protein ACRC6T_09790 [Sarcina sp.]
MVDRVTAKSIRKFSKESGYDCFIDDETNLIYLSTLNYKYILTYNKESRSVVCDDFRCKGKHVYKNLKRKYGIGINVNKAQTILIIVGSLIAIAGAILFGIDRNLILEALIAFAVGIIVLTVGIISAV